MLHESPQMLGGPAGMLVETVMRCGDRPVAEAAQQGLDSW
ncbi:hypothetical protein SCNU_05531 [Gordonia neofelifaecis NRRL B-59395]|uniref:Uncharacterized protein n=1 Tax=Gordonia neofelifaecis NRRL B-59395 TaxID=644548 RepID=F1YGY8_9ACTN|nr:hypothetical protein SCNU_05531 [Gordonia neofelifaecis NRRL B-59395]